MLIAPTAPLNNDSTCSLHWAFLIADTQSHPDVSQETLSICIHKIFVHTKTFLL